MASSGGITITVTGSTTADQISMNLSMMRKEVATFTAVSAGPDTKYVLIETEVKNDGFNSITLVCGLSVQTVLTDTLQRNFDPIQELHDLEGNPGCSDALQPGFAATMT